jgi:hypothetical protein
MAQATRNSTGFATRLSSLFSDPMVREAFERAERDLDHGDCFAIADHPPRLDTGAAEALTNSGVRRVRVLEVA